MKVLALTLFLSLSPAAMTQPPPSAGTPSGNEAVQVQAATWSGTWWNFENLKPVAVTDAGSKEARFTEAFGNRAMYVIAIPAGFDGSISLESEPRFESRMEAWEEKPSLNAISRGILGHASMGNTISFKNNNNQSLIYLSITPLRTPPLASFSITVRIRNSNSAITKNL